jgi:hypothetical protein
VPCGLKLFAGFASGLRSSCCVFLLSLFASEENGGQDGIEAIESASSENTFLKYDGDGCKRSVGRRLLSLLLSKPSIITAVQF